jgi:AcrR family transcriptional regulator
MSRLTRAETQRRNRDRVLAAARDEFLERGFRDAKIDTIAERAELTRGAVYSNFPSKRALYLAVLAAEAEREPTAPTEPGRTVRDALTALATAWVTRLPLSTDQRYGDAMLGAELLPEILAGEPARKPFAQLTRLQATLLGLALEHLDAPAAGRRVRLAEAALTTLYGASQLAAAAPGFVEPFNVVAACRQLADLDLADTWAVPGIVPPTRPTDEPWTPPAATDALRAAPATLNGDGVVVVLGLHRVSAAEEAVRAAPPGATVTVVVVTGAPDELAPLAHLAIAELRALLRASVPATAWPRLQLVLDPAVATAAGVSAVSDATETAVRISGGRIVARADGFGAGHAAATHPVSHPPGTVPNP